MKHWTPASISHGPVRNAQRVPIRHWRIGASREGFRPCKQLATGEHFTSLKTCEMFRLAVFFGFTVVLGLLITQAFAADIPGVPPKPDHYFNDYASLVSPGTARQLDQQLENFERETSNQILVVIYKSLPGGAAVEDFAQGAFRAWKVGQKGKNNGAILFIFVNDRKAWIQTGYGLEGSLPDAICRRIVGDELAPRFQTGDFNGGLTAAVNAMIAATKGEYKGTGKTVGETRKQNAVTANGVIETIFVLIVFGLIGFTFLRNLRRGTLYSSGGAARPGGIWFIGGGGGGDGGGFSDRGGGGGGFSGGGGDSGGGGAGGSW